MLSEIWKKEGEQMINDKEKAEGGFQSGCCHTPAWRSGWCQQFRTELQEVGNICDSLVMEVAAL